MNLGFITPAERNNKQHDAHSRAMRTVRPAAHYGLPVPQLQAGQAVRLFDLWKNSAVVADVGFEFQRIHQLTGSCVWAGGTNAVMSTIAAQCVAGTKPTKAFFPFTLHNYGMSRHYMGDDSEGEGSLGSTFAKSLTVDGIRDWVPGTDGMPRYSSDDGFSVTERDEMSWSSYRNGKQNPILPVSKQHLFGSAAECKTTQDIKAMILNGYGVSFACNLYIGKGSIRGSGNDAYVGGKWDGNGGHQQSIHAYWEHPNDGPLFWAQNNWPGSTYPRDPAGGPVCGVWVREADVESALRQDAEVFGLSHLDWFPATPKLLDWFV